MRSFLIRDILSGSSAPDEDDDEVIDVDEVDEADELFSNGGQATTSGSDNNSAQQQHQQPQHQHQQHQHLTQQQQQQQQHFLAQNSPLAALFQMTSSTFDGLKRKAGNESSKTTTNFTAKQNPKKKRKSRTAFTNSQIYELERRFRLQKYLSPTDRDEIAMTLNLSNAQVITWFQNRRAKMKRDLEEQRRDIETASLLNIQKTFLESLMALSSMNTAPNLKKE